MADAKGHGRLVLLVGPSGDGTHLSAVADRVAARLTRAVRVDASALQALVEGGEPEREDRRGLRYEVSLVVGEVYAGAGDDVVVSDDVPEEDLSAVVNRAVELADAVHLFLLVARDAHTPGVRIDPGGRDADAVAEEVLGRLDEARVGQGSGSAAD